VVYLIVAVLNWLSPSVHDIHVAKVASFSKISVSSTILPTSLPYPGYKDQLKRKIIIWTHLLDFHYCWYTGDIPWFLSVNIGGSLPPNGTSRKGRSKDSSDKDLLTVPSHRRRQSDQTGLLARKYCLLSLPLLGSPGGGGICQPLNMEQRIQTHRAPHPAIDDG